MKLNSATISLYLQQQLRKRNKFEVTAVEAARWLNRAGILNDSTHRPGLPLRSLLRKKEVLGAFQKSGRFWFIEQVNLAPKSIRIHCEKI